MRRIDKNVEKVRGDASQVESDPHSGKLSLAPLLPVHPGTMQTFRAVELKAKREREENLIDADRKRNGTK